MPIDGTNAVYGVPAYSPLEERMPQKGASQNARQDAGQNDEEPPQKDAKQQAPGQPGKTPDKQAEDEKRIFRYGQSLAQAEEAIGRVQSVDPATQEKASAASQAQCLKEEYEAGLETDAPQRLDERD